MGNKNKKRGGIMSRLRVAILEGLLSSQPKTEHTNRLQQRRQSFDMWQPPVNILDPMSVKRNRGGRRVSFHPGVLTETGDTDKTQPQKSDDNVSLDIDLTKTTSLIEVSKADGSSIEVEDENDENECSYDNATFKADEVSHSDCFLSVFGKKGKNIGEFEDAKNITCLPRGRILISDYVNSRLQICSETSKTITVFSPQEINLPWATALTKENFIAVTLCQDRCVKILNLDGDVINSFGNDYFVRPTGLATDKNGNFIVCDSVTNKVSMFDNEGTFIRLLGNSDNKQECFNKPSYVCVSNTNEIIISDSGNHMVKIFDSSGKFVKSFGSFGKKYNQFKFPYGVATNKCGDIFVADHYNSRISMFTRDGVFVRHIVTSEHGLVHPQGLTISDDLHLFITHGHLKASEILVFKLTNDVEYAHNDVISYV